MVTVSSTEVYSEESRLTGEQKSLGDNLDFKTPINRIEECIKNLNNYWNTTGGEEKIKQFNDLYTGLDYTKIEGLLSQIKDAQILIDTYTQSHNINISKD